MRKIDKLLENYAESHQTLLNKQIHYICVPAIFFSLLGLLYCVPVASLFSSFVTEPWLRHFNLATALVIFGILYYATLSMRLMVCMAMMSILSLYLITVIDKIQVASLWLLMVIIFMLAWIGQFIGHKHEGKKPSFFEDLQYLMIGPAWTLSHLFNRLGVRF